MIRGYGVLCTPLTVMCIIEYTLAPRNITGTVNGRGGEAADTRFVTVRAD